MNRKRKANLLLGVGLLLLLTFASSLGITNATPKAEDAKQAQTYIGNLKVDVIDTGTIGNVAVNTVQNRKIEIRNDGDIGQFVRVMLLPEYVNGDGNHEEIKVADLLTDLDATNWKEGKDGYFYLTKKLTGQTVAPVIFSKIKIPNGSAGGKLRVHVKAEAITAAGNQYRMAFWGDTTPPSKEPLKSIDNGLNGEKE